MTGAPYLARFSRDVGHHCSFPLTLESTDALSGQHRWYPTSREKRARCGAPGLRDGTSSLVDFPSSIFPLRRESMARITRLSFIESAVAIGATAAWSFATPAATQT